MKRKAVSLFLVFALFAAILAGCSSNASTPSGADSSAKNSASAGAAPSTTDANKGSGKDAGTVKIGFLGYIAGADTYLGVPPMHAMQDYLEELNAKGGLLGKKVELVTYDISRSIDEVAPAATKMIEQDKVIAIVGPTSSGAAIAATPIVTAAKVPMVATSATNEKVTVNDQGVLQPYTFRVCFIDPYQAEAVAGFAFKDLGYKKIATLTDVTQAYSKGLLDTFRKSYEGLGGKIVDAEGFNENDVEFRAQLAKIANTDAQAIFLPASNFRYGVLVAQQARELGIKLPLLLPDAVYAPELLDNAGKELEGSFVSTGILDDDPAYEEYRTAFAKKHPGEKANIYVYYGLDAIMAVEAAVNKAQSLDPQKIRDALENLTNVKVFTDTLTIDPKTHNPVGKPVTIMQIKDKKFSVYKIYKPN